MNSLKAKINIFSIYIIQKKEILIGLFMLFLIFILNYIHIFEANFLLGDDSGFIYQFQENYLKSYWNNNTAIFYRIFYAYSLYFHMFLMDLNISLSRSFVVLEMFLGSYMFYYILTKYIKLKISISFFAAILPNILPSMWQIPTSVNSSYPASFILFYFLSVIFFINFLQKKKRAYLYFFGGLISYLFFSVPEISPFMFLFSFILMMLFFKIDTKFILVFISISIISIYRFVIMIQRDRTAPISIDFEIIVSRIVRFFEWSSPFYGADSRLIFTGTLFLIIASFYVLSKNENIAFQEEVVVLNKNQKTIKTIYMFAFLWIIANVAVFIIFSKIYTERYVYISTFGMSLLISLSIYTILFKLRLRNSLIVLMLLLITYSGYSKLVTTKRYFKKTNIYIKSLEVNLSGINFPDKSQIVILGTGDDDINIKTVRDRSQMNHLGMGYFKSSAHIRRVLKREDVNGLIVKKLNNYNFTSHINDMRNSAMPYIAMGLNLNFPIFMFEYFEDGRLIQKEFLLEYSKSDDAWILYKFDKVSGKTIGYYQGYGKAKYAEKLKNLNLKEVDVMWGKND